MNLPDNILRMIETSQKISKQMAAANKIAESFKLSENLSKVLNASANIGLTNKQLLSYVSNPNINWATAEDIKFSDYIKPIDYCAYFHAQSQSVLDNGGCFEPLELKPFWHDLKATDNLDALYYTDGYVSLKPALDLIRKEDSNSQLSILNTLNGVYTQRIQESLKSRNQVVDRILDAFYSFEENEFDKFLNSYYHDLHHLLVYDANIRLEFAKIQILNKIYKSIKIGLKKISLNKREFFRKINSFLFKNLDDYHSLAY